jgi:uncharacterized protein (DUF305 family)
MKTRILQPVLGFCLGLSFAHVHVHAADESVEYPLEVCVVSGKKLGSMGEPYEFQYQGKTVKLCCDACLKDFHVEPVRYMKKLDQGGEDLKPLEGKPFEISFLKHMIVHHERGIEMAELANSNSSDPELKRFALEMIERDKAEIARFKLWLSEWHDQKDAEVAGGPGMGMAGHRMEKLERARDAMFDRMFLEMMIHHHQGGIRMASGVEEKTEKEELKTFARQWIDQKNAEIQRMENWKKDKQPGHGHPAPEE